MIPLRRCRRETKAPRRRSGCHHVWSGDITRCNQEHRLWKRGRYPPGRILVFESVPDHEVIRLPAVLSEVLVESRRRPGLNVTDRSAEAVANREQTAVCLTIPRLIGYGTRCEQCYLESPGIPFKRRWSRTGDANRQRQQC